MNIKLFSKSINSVSLGNCLEWYEFGLYSAFASLFSSLFFPTTEHRVAVINIFAIFAVGFLSRPIGALIFGHFGDKIGRVKTLRASILLITSANFLMVCLPTYTQVGILAPILLVLLRLLQGISLGGEYTGIIIYLTEMAPKKNRAFVASFAGTAANLAILTATAVAFILQKILSFSHYQAFGWRLAFLLGGFISFWVAYSRWDLLETADFKAISADKIVSIPLLTAFRSVPWIMLRTVVLVMFGSVLYYTCFIYLQEYLVDILHLPSSLAFTIKFATMTMMLFLVPLGGLLCDVLGRRRTFLLITASLLLCALPCFYLLNSLLLSNIIVAMVIFTLISSVEQGGTTSVTVVEQFPPSLRYSAIAFSYNLAAAVFGGTAPMLAAFLVMVTHNPLAPGYYLLLVAAVTLMTVWFTLPETAPRLIA